MGAGGACACAVIAGRLIQIFVPVINTGAAVGAREVSQLVGVEVVPIADGAFVACGRVGIAYLAYAKAVGMEFLDDASVTANETVGTFKTHDLLLLVFFLVGVGEVG